MQLQITTDYAIRIISYLAQHRNYLSNANEMADQLGISYQYFFKVAMRLKEAGLIVSEQGRHGGYRLAKKASDITLYDIVETMEGSICINRCLESNGYCSRNATPICSVHKILALLQNDIITVLKNTKISDI